MESSDDSCIDSVVSLPQDVLGVIFAHAQIDFWDLPNIAMVSKEWLPIAFRVEEIDLFAYPRQRDLNRYRNLTPSASILVKMTRLRKIRVFGAAKFTPSIIKALGKLEYLSSISFNRTGDYIGDSIIRECLLSLPKLEHFELNHCENVSSNILKHLVTCSQLRTLSLWDNTFIREFDFTGSERVLVAIATSMPWLESLRWNVIGDVSEKEWNSIGQLKRLKRLEIWYHNSGAIPSGFCDATSLQELTIHSHSRFTLPLTGMSQWINLMKLKIQVPSYFSENIGFDSRINDDVPPNLRELILIGTAILYPNITAALASSLQYIHIDTPGGITQIQLDLLRGMPNLRNIKLRLSEYEMKQEFVDQFIKDKKDIIEIEKKLF